MDWAFQTNASRLARASPMAGQCRRLPAVCTGRMGARAVTKSAPPGKNR